MELEIKKISTSDLSLTHYDPKKDSIVANDVSNLDLGTIILRLCMHQEPYYQVKKVTDKSKKRL